MKTTTVKELLAVLLHRDGNEVITVRDNKLWVVQPVDLLELASKSKLPSMQSISESDSLVSTQRHVYVHPAPAIVGRKLKRRVVPHSPELRNQRKAWKPEENARLLELSIDCDDYESIAKVLGRTKKAISDQLGKLRNSGNATPPKLPTPSKSTVQPLM